MMVAGADVDWLQTVLADDAIVLGQLYLDEAGNAGLPTRAR
jgi:hypothetical protein